VQQGGFTAATAADQGDLFTGLDAQLYVFQGGRRLPLKGMRNEIDTDIRTHKKTSKFAFPNLCRDHAIQYYTLFSGGLLKKSNI
jgi:hypothetical protein